MTNKRWYEKFEGNRVVNVLNYSQGNDLHINLTIEIEKKYIIIVTS